MKRLSLLFFLIFILVLYGENINDEIKYIKNIDINLKKLSYKEEKYMKKLKKLSNAQSIFRKRAKESYLKKLNEIQTEKKELTNEKNSKLKILKRDLEKNLQSLYSKIFSKENNENQIFDLQKQYMYLKKVYDFYFGKKIDIIIYKNEPEDIVKQKMKVLNERISLLKKEIKINKNLIGKLNGQIQFFKETKMVGNSEFIQDYLEFLSQSKQYLLNDNEKKEKILQFYNDKIKEMGGLEHEKN